MAKRNTARGALIAAALCTGCGAGPQQNGTNMSAAPAGDAGASTPASGGVRVPLLRQDGIADAALMDGYLHVEGPCVYIRQRDGTGVPTLPAFTVAVSWDAQSNVLVAGPHRIRPGERVELGGSAANDPRRLRWVQAPAPSCNTASVFVSNSIAPAAEAPLR